MKYVCILLIFALIFSKPLFGFDFSGTYQSTCHTSVKTIERYQSGLSVIQLMGKTPENVMDYVLDAKTAGTKNQSTQNHSLESQVLIGCAVVGCLGLVGCLFVMSEMEDGLFGTFVF